MAAEKDIERGAELLEGALADGELSKESSKALLAAGNVGPEIGMALGDKAGEGDLLLATILIDDSLSIGNIANGVTAVTQGHNYCLEALEGESHSDVLVHTRYLNRGGLSSYQPLPTAPRLSQENYQLREFTPLYKQTVLTLGAVIAKTREQQRRGRQVRAFTMIIADGEDNASGQVIAAHVRFLTRDMLDFSDDHIVAGMGIGATARFQTVFKNMGIPKQWILTAPASAEEIRKLFRRIAKSLQLAAGGGEAGWLELEAGPVSDEG